MVDPSTIFIDGTHIKASANKKKFRKEQVAKAAKVYSGQLRREVNEEREKLGKKPIEDEDDENHPQGGGGETVEKTVSITDPDCGMFVKGEHERQFAYEAHTACDKRGFVLGVEVTAGNVHDSVAWDKVYDNVTGKFEVQFVTMDAGYKTPWIAKKTIEGSKIPILPYTRYTGKKDCYKPWEYTYDPANDTYICPRGGILRHTTTDREGKRTYRSTPEQCRDCPCKAKCGANEKGKSYSQPTSGRSIWIWSNRYEKQIAGKKFMHSARRPLSGSLRTQKRNTPCVIHTTEAWPPSPDGSGLNLLP